MINQDKAGQEYWSHLWNQSDLPPEFNFTSRRLNDYPNRILHNLFSQNLKDLHGADYKLLEIGCGNSIFLPYFQKQYGFKVYGIDYSETGCEQAKAILNREGVSGEIILGDAFKPSEELIGKFDIVCSFGVAEHFEDTTATLTAFSTYLKPGGMLITTIPNLSGITGWLQKKMNKPVYDIHVPMDKSMLENAILKSGLKLEFSAYFLPVSFAVTLDGKSGSKIPNYPIKFVLLKSIRYFSKVIWLIDNMFHLVPARKMFSGGIFTVAKKHNA